MSHYKLTYFGARGLAEHIRFILVVANVPFEDERLDFDQWDELKHNYKFGQLPVLKVDGRELRQSMAIGRFLAKKYKLVARDPFLDARADEVVEIATELRLEFRSFMIEREDENLRSAWKQDLVEIAFPKYYAWLEELVAETSGNFITGNIPVWQDLFIANWLEIWEELVHGPEFLNGYPALKKVQQAVFAVPAIQNYLMTRPKTFI